MQQNEYVMKFGGISDGPDIIGRDRHRVLLNQIFKSLPFTNFGFVRPHYHLHFAGRFSEKPIEDGVAAVRIYRDGFAGIEITLSTATILLPEEQFRDALAALIRSGAARLVAHAAKKKVDFNSESFLNTIEEGLKLYLSADLPLPATNAEIEQAQKLLGIPQVDWD